MCAGKRTRASLLCVTSPSLFFGFGSVVLFVRLLVVSAYTRFNLISFSRRADDAEPDFECEPECELHYVLNHALATAFLCTCFGPVAIGYFIVIRQLVITPKTDHRPVAPAPRVGGAGQAPGFLCSGPGSDNRSRKDVCLHHADASTTRQSACRSYIGRWPTCIP